MSVLETMDEAKVQVDAFKNTRTDFNAQLERTLDPASLAMRAQIQTKYSHVERAIDQLSEHIEELQTSHDVKKKFLDRPSVHSEMAIASVVDVLCFMF